jgi:hypothetical protein
MTLPFRHVAIASAAVPPSLARAWPGASASAVLVPTAYYSEQPRQAEICTALPAFSPRYHRRPRTPRTPACLLHLLLPALTIMTAVPFVGTKNMTYLFCRDGAADVAGRCRVLPGSGSSMFGSVPGASLHGMTAFAALSCWIGIRLASAPAILRAAWRLRGVTGKYLLPRTRYFAFILRWYIVPVAIPFLSQGDDRVLCGFTLFGTSINTTAARCYQGRHTGIRDEFSRSSSCIQTLPLALRVLACLPVLR